MDGYTYGYTTGGEHVCERCGVPARSTTLHNVWHNELDRQALAWDRGYVTARAEIQKAWDGCAGGT